MYLAVLSVSPVVFAGLLADLMDESTKGTIGTVGGTASIVVLGYMLARDFLQKRFDSAKQDKANRHEVDMKKLEIELVDRMEAVEHNQERVRQNQHDLRNDVQTNSNQIMLQAERAAKAAEEAKIKAEVAQRNGEVLAKIEQENARQTEKLTGIERKVNGEHDKKHRELLETIRAACEQINRVSQDVAAIKTKLGMS